MTHVRLLIPFGVDLAVPAGVADRNPDQYRRFWTSARTALAALPADVRSCADIRLPDAMARAQGSSYSSIDTGSFTHLPHLLDIVIDPEGMDLQQTPSAVTAVDGVRVLIYPHQLGLVEVSVSIGNTPDPTRGYEEWLDELQRESVAFGEQLTRTISRRVVNPVVDVLRAADRKKEFFLPPYQGSLEMGTALWVSRGLLVSPEHRPLLSHWTKDVVGSDGESLRDELLDGTRNSLVRWLNYAFVDSDREGADALDSGPHAAEVSALRMAQVVYASLERVDSQLKLVLSEAAAAHTRWQLGLLHEDLSQLSTRAELIVMERQEMQKFMPRQVREHFEKILSAWEYDALVEGPALFKIELCNRRLSDLSTKRAARSSLVTDLILLGIGVTSIAGVALAITEFGRNAAASAYSTGYDLGGSDFTSWFATQPIDLILTASAAVSVIVVALYLYFRRDNRE